jgi:hypothetical protein
MWCRRRQRAPHDVGERCTITPHTGRKRTAQARTAGAGTAGARNASMGSASAITQACTASACTAGTRNASMGDTVTTTQACTAPAQSTGVEKWPLFDTLTHILFANLYGQKCMFHVPRVSPPYPIGLRHWKSIIKPAWHTHCKTGTGLRCATGVRELRAGRKGVCAGAAARRVRSRRRARRAAVSPAA